MASNRHSVLVLTILSLLLGDPGIVRLAHGQQKEGAAQLIFVRAFSSAQDVKQNAHPILNKTLDIIAGPKEAEPVVSALQEPYAVTTDLAHRIYVTDIGAGAVHVFDFARSEYSVLRGSEKLRTPAGIAADREGNIYVSDSGLQTILIYDTKGKFVRYVKKAGKHESYFDAPRGIAIDPVTNRLYVCDTTRNRIIVLDRKDRIVARIGSGRGGSGSGEFRHPIQVVIAGDEIVVLDSGNFRVQILDLRGKFRREIRLGNVSEGGGLAVDHEKRIYVTDPELNRLQVFGPEGKALYQFGEAGTEAGQFNGMSGISVDSRSCLYLVDTQNKRVQAFRATAGDQDQACSF
jgi:DNA-binding beta-propeller fold protein YncE